MFLTENTPGTNPSAFQAPAEVELFVLQKCWFSGPHHEPSIDCLRLFTSRREAEEVGFHAAHEFANQSIFWANNKNAAVGPTRQHMNAVVKTILLPPSTLGAVSSSYAFQTCGKLFWVRSLKATIVPCDSFPFGSSRQFATAHVVLTQGIIGGTGNPNSRRGGEVSEGRVFVSTDNSKAHHCAVHVASQLQQTMVHNPNVNIGVVTVPIGKPHHGTVLEWPAAPGSFKPQADAPMSIAADSSNKREHSQANQMEWADQQSNSSQPLKRRQVSL